VGKLYVLRSDFSCTYVLQTLSSGHIICPAPVISPALHVLQNPAHWENYMFYLVTSPTLHILESLPIWKILCPVSDLSYALNTGKPAQWANSMSYPVMYPTLYVPETLPVGQIPPRSESSGQGPWNTFPKCAEFPVLVLHSWAPPLPSPPPGVPEQAERARERG